MKIIQMQTCGSTNSELAKLVDVDPGTVVVTDCQMAGRGQRGNSWESETGKNLIFSLLLKPYSISAAHQFELSMLVSTGIVNAMATYLPEAERPLIKWPNDIYVGDRKLCGILIENTLDGPSISRSIVGIGINVNQTHFVSDAPNPVSLSMLTGKTYDLEEVLNRVVTAIMDIFDQYENDPEPAELQSLYMQNLWRNDGRTYAWTDRASGQTFEASIYSVAPDGTLTLRTPDGTLRPFLFKEVAPAGYKN